MAAILVHGGSKTISVRLQVKYQQKYEQEIKGKASTNAGAAEFALAKEHAEHLSQVRLFFTYIKVSPLINKVSYDCNGSLFPSACLHGRV